MPAVLAVLLPIGCSDDGAAGDEVWVGTWSRALHAPVAPQSIAAGTIRQVVRCSIGGERVRVRLSNRFGTAPLRVERATVGGAEGGHQVTADSLRVLTFDGEQSVSIAAGSEVTSDAVDLAVAPLGELALSLFFRDRTSLTSIHAVAVRNAYFAAGDQTAAAQLSDAEERPGLYLFAGVEVAGAARPVVVAFGDSITDGFGATEPGGGWPERLAARADGALAILNLGISGNRILGSANPLFGPSALERLAGDALTQPGAALLVVQEGINDIQWPALSAAFGEDPPAPPISADDLISGLRQIIRRARAAGLAVVGGTLLPYETLPRLVEDGEETRQEFNRWIRDGGELDAVIDFDAVLRDPANPQRLLPRYDSGDSLHPSDAGYAAMAEEAQRVLAPLLSAAARPDEGGAAAAR